MMLTKKSGPLSCFLLLVLIVLVLLPQILPPYPLRLATEAMIFSLFAVSFNMLLGYAGLLSFGHAMFFGVGAFATAVAVNRLPGISFAEAVAVSTIITAVVSLAVGTLLLRVKGTPFALLTLAFNALFYAIGVKWSSVTGGDDGQGFTPPVVSLGGITYNPGQGNDMYYLTLVIVGVVIVGCWYFTRTAMGQSVLLIRENEERMQFLGYNTKVTRLILFSLAGSLAGLAGSLHAMFNAFVSLDVISLEMSTKVLLMTFIGGTGAFFGPVLGSYFYIFVQDSLSEFTNNWPLFMGLLFILMVLYVPKGFSGLLKKMIPRFMKGNNHKFNREKQKTQATHKKTRHVVTQESRKETN
jgi:ABC-type branched-subunit amino acid transport system permease subunit